MSECKLREESNTLLDFGGPPGVKVIAKDVIHGYLHDSPGQDPASLLLYEIQFHVQAPDDKGWLVQLNCFYSGNNLELVGAVPPTNHKYETQDEKGRRSEDIPTRPKDIEETETSATTSSSRSSKGITASWEFVVLDSDEASINSLRVAILLNRSNDDKFQGTFHVRVESRNLLEEALNESSEDHPTIYDPSVLPTNGWDLEETENLGSIDLLKFCNNRPRLNSYIFEKGASLDTEDASTKEPIPAVELPTPETLVESALLSWYFEQPTIGRGETPMTIPLYASVVNQSSEDITVVIDRYHSSDVSSIGPVAQITLPPYSKDSERSSVLLPLCGGISLFSSPKQTPWPQLKPPTSSRIHIIGESQVLVMPNETTPEEANLLLPITFNGKTAHPATTEMDSKEMSNYILIQTYVALSSPQMNQLEDSGLHFLEYISKNTYLYKRHHAGLRDIGRLHYVAYIGTYGKGYKISTSLESTPRLPRGHPSRTPCLVDIVFHNDVEPATLRDRVAEAAHVIPETLDFGQHKLRHTIQKQYLEDLASIDEVRFISEVRKSELRGVTARQILEADGRNNPGVEHNEVYEGEGEVIAVADTGLDTGNITNLHGAFSMPHDDHRNTRVTSMYPLSQCKRTNDTDGHGTHVCGLVVGSYRIRGGEHSGLELKGTAPRAQLVFQCLGSDINGIPTELGTLFEDPYHSNGVRVHTNSWGAIWRGYQYQYSHMNRAEEIDRFIWEHPDMVICFAAGNDWEEKLGPQIGAEAAAKNCITVGATENDLQYAYQIYEYSSSGPTAEGRTKPDVVAPGNHVLSAKSLDSRAKSPYSGDSSWCYESGTSMATPLVAGCAAVLRNAIKDRGELQNPPASLIKALLINGAVLLPKYSRDEVGFGRVNLAQSLAVACRRGGAGFINRRLYLSDKPYKIPIIIPDSESMSNFKVTLVWTDPPGPAIYNYLTLSVRASDREEREGNIGEANNVQQVEWVGIPSGEAVITIKVVRISPRRQKHVGFRGPQQEFACV